MNQAKSAQKMETHFKNRQKIQEEIVEKTRGLFYQSVVRLRKNKMATYSLLYLIVLTGLCFFSEYFVSTPWDELNFETVEALPPSSEHWFGTGVQGMDLFSRVLYGGKISLSVGIITTAVAGVLGLLYGAVSGYMGGKADQFMMRFVDFLDSLPYYFVLILIMVFFNVESIYSLFLIIALFQWLGMARIIRGQVLSLKEKDFIMALESCGVSHTRIVLRHVIPNVLGLAVVYATLMVPGIMLQEAFLSFIGLTFQVEGTDQVAKDAVSWGTLLGEGAMHYKEHWWLLAIPAVFFSVTLLAINFLGDGLRDALDPNQKLN